MKRLAIIGLAIALFTTSVVTPVMALEPTVKAQGILAQGRRGPGPRGHRPPPPPPRHDRDRRHGKRGSDWVGFGIGAAVGAAIGAGVASSSKSDNYYYYQPAPQPVPVPVQPVMVYDPACNCYYYR